MKTVGYLFRWSIIGVALIALAGNIQASVRPYGDAAQLAELQGVFDGIGATSIDAVNDQIDEMAFEPTSPTASGQYLATVSWSAGDIDFGIYNLADTAQQLSMFNTAASSVGESAWLQFNLAGNYVRTVDAETLSVIESSDYFGQFGFYATSYQGTFYSEDNLNTGDFAHFLSYASEGDSVTIGGVPYTDDGHYYVASEVGYVDTSNPGADFSDMVVRMESITPIPEPASVVLLVGASSLITFIRHRFVV